MNSSTSDGVEEVPAAVMGDQSTGAAVSPGFSRQRRENHHMASVVLPAALVTSPRPDDRSGWAVWDVLAVQPMSHSMGLLRRASLKRSSSVLYF